MTSNRQRPSPVRVARVREGTREPHAFFRLDGIEAVAIELRQQRGHSPVRVAANLRHAVDELEVRYAGTLRLAVVGDGTAEIRRSLGDLAAAGGIGVLAAFGVLLVLTRRFLVAATVVASIPLTLLLCAVVLWLLGITLNIMSLGGLAIGVGLVVDNSVVVADRMARATRTSAARAAAEVVGDTLGSTATTVLVFVPLLILPGLLGALFADLAVAVCVALTTSYLVSVTFTPAALATLAPRSQRAGGATLDAAYRRALQAATRHPLATTGIALAMLPTGGVVTGTLPVELFPRQPSAELTGDITLPNDASMQRASAAGAAVSERLLQDPRVAAVAGAEPVDFARAADPTHDPKRVALWIELRRDTPHPEELAVELAAAVAEPPAVVGAALRLRPPVGAAELALTGSGGATVIARASTPAAASATALRVLSHASPADGLALSSGGLTGAPTVVSCSFWQRWQLRFCTSCWRRSFSRCCCHCFSCRRSSLGCRALPLRCACLPSP